MEQLRKLPIGVQQFEKLRKEGYLYIDKTRVICDMISRGSYYFLSRPRRFGKSLLMSTIHAIYEGKRELFKGLYIDGVEDWDWTPHPVLHLDLNTNAYNAPEVLDKKLDEALSTWESLYQCDKKDMPFGMRFERVISKAYQLTGQRAVILVDEYDKPMLQAIGNPELQDAYRSTLKGFYGALKSMDGCIQFALLTGVTKFGKVSVFSDLNNLNDISMDADYWDVCGITEQELLSCLDPEIENMARANRLTKEECIARLRQQYDGYHFEEDTPGVYNPFSLLNALSKRKFGSYWFETGTPTYLVQLLQLHDYNLEAMSEYTTSESVLNSIDANNTNPIPVIYQSGYLTIKGYDKRFGTYTLGFPNEEVEQGFLDYLLPFYSSVKRVDTAFNIQQFVLDVEAGRTEAFLTRLRSLFADTPYELVRDLENHYQNVIWLVTKLMGFYVQAEYHTSRGRIDLVLQTPQYCYVMEFKLDGTAEEALAQISDRQYTLPFELNGQQIIRIGLNFSSQTRNIEHWVVG